MASVEMDAKQIGRSINMTLSPLPVGKRKRRFSIPENDVDDDLDDANDANDANDGDDHDEDED
jgi:hypothetical protein